MIIAIDSSRIQSEVSLLIGKKVTTKKFDITEDIPLFLKKFSSDLDKLKAVVISIGPGSFTGLRVGLSIAKGLTFKSDIDIYGIRTFDAMLINFKDGVYIPLLYAKTDFVYSAIIEKMGFELKRVKKDGVYSVKEVKNWKGIFIGEKIEGFENVEEVSNSTLGLLKIYNLIKNGEYIDYILNPVEPIYLSLSEAEIKRSSVNMVYKDIEKGDLSQILEIEKESFLEPWDKFTFQYILSNKDCYAKKAIIGDTILGYIIGCFENDVFHFMNIAVRKNLRRKGIGKNLIFRMIKDIEKKVSKIYLEVRITNEPAINLYKMMGFKIEGIKKNYYSNDEDAIIMSLQIK